MDLENQERKSFKASDKSILIADDNHEFRQLLSEDLEGAGYKVLEANNGWSCLGQLDLAPSLLILDISMPGMDGLSALRLMRTGPRVCQLPVIIMSGQRVKPELFRDLNIVGILYKPFGIDDFLATVEYGIASWNSNRSGANKS